MNNICKLIKILSNYKCLKLINDSNNIEINKLAGCGCTKTVYYIDDSNKKRSYEETKFKLVNHYFNYIFPQKSSETTL